MKMDENGLRSVCNSTGEEWIAVGEDPTGLYKDSIVLSEVLF